MSDDKNGEDRRARALIDGCLEPLDPDRSAAEQLLERNNRLLAAILAVLAGLPR